MSSFMKISRHTFIKFILILLLPLCYQSSLADELKEKEKENTYLNVARTQLDIAFENYNKGDIAASKKNLKHASEWLYKAVNHSRSDIVKNEAKKLAEEIDSFSHTLNQSSEIHSLARFWHQTTSLIMRESEHLIHSYTETLTDDKIFRNLLDAKMHFNNADHDLFLSHDSKDATIELNNSLEYLAEAESLAGPELKPYVNKMITGINELISLSDRNESAWKKDTLVHSLDDAIKNLNEAESFASPPTRMRLELIKERISKLKIDTKKTSLKEKYESIMDDFRRAINNIN